MTTRACWPGRPRNPADVPVSLDDPCLIMYTSGTTGRAKGATLTHGNITWNAINVVVDADFRADEVALAVAPLFHTAALNMLCLPTMLKGGTVADRAGLRPGPGPGADRPLPGDLDVRCPRHLRRDGGGPGLG